MAFSQEKPRPEFALVGVAGIYPTSPPDSPSGHATYLSLEQSGKFALSEYCFSGDVGIEGGRQGRQSTVEWSWPQGGTPMRAGMELTSQCLR